MDWIDINKELPQYYTPVIVQTKDKKIYIAWRHTDGEQDYYTIYDTDDGLCGSDVDYWMHTPKPK